jgi:hypothetical protein
MDTFSWSDSLRALTAPCFDCLRPSKNERNDLEDLLADSGSATVSTADAETLSLHSNPSTRRRKRARFTKNIRLFGWDLFGRRQPIRLPDDDDEDEDENEDGGGGGQEQVEQSRKKIRSHRGHRRPPPVTISSSTLDSDAAPLDSAVIASHATNYAEEEAKRAERRARRCERREMKRAAAFALEQAAILEGGNEFEGFPGSGSRRAEGVAGSPPPFVRDDGAMTTQELRLVPNEEEEEEDDEVGDFGADAYARRTSGSSDSGRGSDSRSRTSTTTSVSGQAYNHHYISQQPIAHPSATTAAAPPLLPVRRTKNKNKSSRSSASKSSSSASSTKRSRSSPSESLSPSLSSPVAPAAPHSPTTTTTTSTTHAVPQETFEGFTNGGLPRLQTAGIEQPSSSGFPSPGIGGPRNVKRDLGAFLANRGDA